MLSFLMYLYIFKDLTHLRMNNQDLIGQLKEGKEDTLSYTST